MAVYILTSVCPCRLHIPQHTRPDSNLSWSTQKSEVERCGCGTFHWGGGFMGRHGGKGHKGVGFILLGVLARRDCIWAGT